MNKQLLRSLVFSSKGVKAELQNLATKQIAVYPCATKISQKTFFNC